MNLSNYPIVKILIPYAIGIIATYYCHFLQHNGLFLWFATIAIWLLSACFLRIKNYYWQWFRDLTLAIGFIFAGIFTTNFHYLALPTEVEQEHMAQNRNWHCLILTF